MTATRRSSLLLILGTDLCAALAALSVLPAITVIAGLPLVLYAPGAAFLLAVDPHRRQVKGVQRLMWTVAASLGTVIMSGLLLNLFGGLTRTHWLVLLTVVVLILAIVGWFRGASRAEPATETGDGAVPSALGPVDSDTEPESSTGPSHPAGIRQAALLMATAGVVAGALLLSLHSAAVASRESFVQAWIVTQPVNDIWSTSAQMGVTNHEGHRSQFVVEEVIGRSAPQQQKITLDDAQTWHLRVQRNAGEPVVVTVLSGAHSKAPLASVSLAQPVPARPKTSTTTTNKPTATTATTATTSPH